MAAAIVTPFIPILLNLANTLTTRIISMSVSSNFLIPGPKRERILPKLMDETLRKHACINVVLMGYTNTGKSTLCDILKGGVPRYSGGQEMKTTGVRIFTYHFTKTNEETKLEESSILNIIDVPGFEKESDVNPKLSQIFGLLGTIPIHKMIIVVSYQRLTAAQDEVISTFASSISEEFKTKYSEKCILLITSLDEEKLVDARSNCPAIVLIDQVFPQIIVTSYNYIYSKDVMEAFPNSEEGATIKRKQILEKILPFLLDNNDNPKSAEELMKMSGCCH
jgi:GTP-binding protein EngB required for normal cell division